MKKINIGFTGHRYQRLNFNPDETHEDWIGLYSWIFDEYKKLASKYDEIHVYCGMCSGGDIAFGLCLGALEKVKLHCILPFKDYNCENKYYDILHEVADEWIELADSWHKKCDSERDQYVVDHSDMLYAMFDGIKQGGVYSTIRKAQKAHKKIVLCPQEVLYGSESR